MNRQIIITLDKETHIASRGDAFCYTARTKHRREEPGEALHHRAFRKGGTT